LQIIKILLVHGADVHAREKKGGSPLHLANSSDKIDILVQHGANVDARDNFGGTPLHRAQNYKIAAALLKNDADAGCLDECCKTALHFAKDAGTVKLLVAAGVPIDWVDDNGETALDCSEATRMPTAKLVQEQLKKMQAQNGNEVRKQETKQAEKILKQEEDRILTENKKTEAHQKFNFGQFGKGIFFSGLTLLVAAIAVVISSRTFHD
jgi:ankyrin repeat protein